VAGAPQRVHYEDRPRALSFPPVTHPAIDSATYRNVMGHFLTGVTIITAIDPEDATPVGFAASSFTSVSLDPALVLFCAGSNSSTWPRIKRAGRYCVNILGADAQWMSRQFSSKVPDKFADVPWHPGVSGSPVIDDASAFVDCEIYEEVVAGDHMIVVGRVLDLGARDGAGPLGYYRGSYGEFTASAG
jgi:3-hydroxy-9,10-secoandrosta-1,3,5(10)-triene-9,17-dione monooxygenase reductase component